MLDLTNEGVDHAIEAIGSKPTAEQAFAMLAHGSTTTVIGMMAADTRIEVPAASLLKERKIQGSPMGSVRFRVDIPMLPNLYQTRRFDLDPLIADTISLDEIDDGFEALSRGRLGRCVIEF